MEEKIGRREFFKRGAKIGLSAVAGSSVLYQVIEGSVHAIGAEKIDVAVVRGSDYLQNTIKVVELLGGMEKFVQKDSRVAILPNTQSRHPGTYTKPEIARAVVRMCQKAGAREVSCLSWLTRKDWEGTGLAQAVEEEGANVKLVDRDDESLFKAVPVPHGKVLKEAKIMKEFFDNDVFIDMPITKDHAGNRFTGTMKNLMALNFRTVNRSFHKEDWTTNKSSIEYLDQCIADLNTVIKPALCVVDATEFITTNGPFGPGEIIKPLKVVAGVDRVAIDAYCASLWGLDAKDIVMIQKGFEHKLGQIDLSKVRIKEIEI